jgi:hypothetical protein
MNDSIFAYKAWAPDGAIWSPWTKPVLFANLRHKGSFPLRTSAVDWVSYPDRRTALIVDLPGAEGVAEGLALAELGYRPVALYNGVDGPNMAKTIVKTRELAQAVFHAADTLSVLRLPFDAPPAFLLDSNRMSGAGKRPGMYDNRWCVFAQDMPSAEFLKQRGISRIILRSAFIQSDLTHVLCRYQQAGIAILHAKDGAQPEPVTVAAPSFFKSAYYRFRIMCGLTRNAAGGFGAMVPEPQQSSGGGVRYYGYG